MADFGVSIAVPVVLLSVIGKWLDERYGTGPVLKIIGFVLAFILTALIINRKAKYYGKVYKEIEKNSRKI